MFQAFFQSVCDVKEYSIYQGRLFPSQVMAPGYYLAKQQCCAFLAHRILTISKGNS